MYAEKASFSAVTTWRMDPQQVQPSLLSSPFKVPQAPISNSSTATEGVVSTVSSSVSKDSVTNRPMKQANPSLHQVLTDAVMLRNMQTAMAAAALCSMKPLLPLLGSTNKNHALPRLFSSSNPSPLHPFRHTHPTACDANGTNNVNSPCDSTSPASAEVNAAAAAAAYWAALQHHQQSPSSHHDSLPAAVMKSVLTRYGNCALPKPNSLLSSSSPSAMTNSSSAASQLFPEIGLSSPSSSTVSPQQQHHQPLHDLQNFTKTQDYLPQLNSSNLGRAATTVAVSNNDTRKVRNSANACNTENAHHALLLAMDSGRNPHQSQQQDELRATGHPNIYCTRLPLHWRSNKSLHQVFRVVVTQPIIVPDGTRVLLQADGEDGQPAELRNFEAYMQQQEAKFDDLRFIGRSGRGKYFNLTIRIFTVPQTLVALYSRAIKVTVDGPRGPRTKPTALNATNSSINSGGSHKYHLPRRGTLKRRGSTLLCSSTGTLSRWEQSGQQSSTGTHAETALSSSSSVIQCESQLPLPISIPHFNSSVVMPPIGNTTRPHSKRQTLTDVVAKSGTLEMALKSDNGSPHKPSRRTHSDNLSDNDLCLGTSAGTSEKDECPPYAKRASQSLSPPEWRSPQPPSVSAAPTPLHNNNNNSHSISGATSCFSPQRPKIPAFQPQPRLSDPVSLGLLPPAYSALNRGMIPVSGFMSPGTNGSQMPPSMLNELPIMFQPNRLNTIPYGRFPYANGIPTLMPSPALLPPILPSSVHSTSSNTPFWYAAAAAAAAAVAAASASPQSTTTSPPAQKPLNIIHSFVHTGLRDMLTKTTDDEEVNTGIKNDDSGDMEEDSHEGRRSATRGSEEDTEDECEHLIVVEDDQDTDAESTDQHKVWRPF